MPDPKNPGDRVQAHKLRARQKQGALEPVHALWLAEYEEKQQKQRQHASGAPDVGASRSSRKISLDIDENAEAIGTGNAAVTAASAALVVKEEGRRLDALLLTAVDAMKLSADINRQTALMLREDYGALFELLSKRTEILEATHIEMLHTVRTHFLSATQMEGALMNKDAETDPSMAMLVALIAKQLGVDVPVGVLPGVVGKRPPPNGKIS